MLEYYFSENILPILNSMEKQLYMKEICAIIMKNSRAGIDIMNRNTIISLAMLYALWQSNRQDLLDLIRPFMLLETRQW